MRNYLISESTKYWRRKKIKSNTSEQNLKDKVYKSILNPMEKSKVKIFFDFKEFVSDFDKVQVFWEGDKNLTNSFIWFEIY